MIGIGLISFYSTYEHLISPVPLVEDSVFFTEFFLTFVKYQMTVVMSSHVWVLLLYSIPLICMHIFVPVSYFLVIMAV